ncbi:hypothetical protein Mtc_2049 [Methanocella conradii HZ254]|uniref:Uncharacterized protein n=1 Tax=Methanocella conradii (strain DSM 24694 / JCM 17849 / CGMCC 1.5162 / HZ254) TaxID=1041930 RepID=H8I7C2_METCZ|nr:hypothetical protein [Methanocella conradii]AFD00788.1 hypothetical protein Mtc_2049 [Methanocella conradii HZ254]
MTVPEQGEPGLNPKYVEKLVEARLYAINDKKYYDGVIITFYCPRCSHNNTVMKPLFFHSLSMDSFLHAISGYRFETHTCVCGNRLDYKNIVIAQYSHFFSDAGLDLQAELTRDSEFVSFYRMDLNGVREPLDNVMDFRYMYRMFGHVLSVREAWKHMLSTVRETKSIQVYDVEKGYVIAAVPGDIPHQDVTMREMLGPSWPGSSAVVVRLGEMDGEREQYEDSYREWMPEFVEDIRRGRIDASAVIDAQMARKLAENTLKREGIDYIIKDDVCRIDKKPFRVSFSFKDIVKSAAYRGKSLQEAVDEKVDVAVNKIQSAESLYKSLRRDLPSYDFSINHDMLEVINPRTGESVKIDPYGPLPKGGIREMVASLRAELSKNEKFQPVCKCGRQAFILKSIEPATWLKSTKDAFDLVYEERDNAVVVYNIACGEHVNPVKKTDLAEWLIERKDLDELFEEELNSLRINVEAHVGKFGADVIVGALSNNACDIMVHPGFVKGLLDALKVDMGDRVIVYAPMKELILIYREDADVNNLNTAMLQLQEIVAAKDLSQTLLDYACVYDLDEGHGIFNIVDLPEKRGEAEDYPIAELPPEEVDGAGNVVPEQGHHDVSGAR